MSNSEDYDEQPVDPKPHRKPTKLSRIKALEKELLQQTIVVKQAKIKYKQLVEEYNNLIA